MVATSALFQRAPLDGVLAREAQKMVDEINRAPRERVASDDQAAEFAAKYRVEPLVIHADRKRVDVADADVDPSRDPYYGAVHDMLRRGSGQVRGNRITVKVPFDGDPALLDCRPNSWDTHPPIGEVIGREVVYSFDRVRTEAAEMQERIDENVKALEQWARYSAHDVVRFNNGLEGKARDAVARRRKKIDDDEELRNKLR